MKTSPLLLLAVLFFACQTEKNKAFKVELVKSDGNYQMMVYGEPFYVKGAVGLRYMEAISAYGGNAVRIYRPDKKLLDKADSLGLKVLFALPVQAERNGMNYSDEQVVKEQFDKCMAIVRDMKDHTGIIMWQLGNELDYIRHDIMPDWKVYDAVNDLAKAIHIADPSRPVLTVLGTGKRFKMEKFVKQCQGIDLLGINAYGDIGEMKEWMNSYGWTKPYVYCEWGPTGFWQVPANKWGLWVEETSTEKGHVYKDRYENVILADAAQCIGSFVFFWDQKMEKTHTWFGMFDPQWRESAAVDVMRYEWTGEWPDNLATIVKDFTLDGKSRSEDILLEPGLQYTAEVEFKDPENDELVFDWEILPEITEFGYGGGGEVKPDPIDVIVSDKNQPEITFKAPVEMNNYRLFVYIYDEANHYSYANIPFRVEK